MKKTYWIIKDAKTGVYYSRHGIVREFNHNSCVMSHQKAKAVLDGFSDELLHKGRDGHMYSDRQLNGLPETAEPELIQVRPTYERV